MYFYQSAKASSANKIPALPCVLEFSNRSFFYKELGVTAEQYDKMDSRWASLMILISSAKNRAEKDRFDEQARKK